MDYTPHEWVDGETITAAKLNNIEQGIAEASQNSGSAILFAQPSGFGSTSHNLGFIGYFKQINSKWQLVGADSVLGWFDNDFCMTPALPIPPNDFGLKIFWAIYYPHLSDVDITLSGSISENSITVYQGTSEFVGYELTGIAYVEIVAT